MNINDIYKTIQFIVRKNTTGGLINPDQFNLIINRAQMTKFMRSYGNEQEYAPGRPIPRIAFEENQNITDELSIFIENANMILDANGQAPYPDDYVHTIPGLGYKTAINNSNGTGTTIKYVPITIIDKQYEFYRLSSNIVQPTRTSPICVEDGLNLQFYPIDIGPVRFPYLRQPKQAIWAFTMVNNRPVYDPINSVDLEWKEVNINSIISLAISYLGISIKDSDVQNYALTSYAQGI